MYVNVEEMVELQNSIINIYMFKKVGMVILLSVRRVHVSQWFVGDVFSRTQRKLTIVFVEAMLAGRNNTKKNK